MTKMPQLPKNYQNDENATLFLPNDPTILFYLLYARGLVSN